MRFLANGPSIPDELLLARDEGRVVFFCGAGVSRARAGLSDFFGLAETVIQKLGVPTDSPARRILQEAREIGKRTGVQGLISVDRIFGLLERDFLVRDIESAVANVLRPNDKVDLTAHQILIDLARTVEGKVRLVTTNFDRLFDACDSSLQIFRPPRLPDPLRHDQMDGIIYLHGCADKEYTGAAGDGFVLSSAEFGRAYLSDGWATKFFREIIARYIVVFVGYSADDPPVQYLLEALNGNHKQLQGVYAFQAGTTNDAAAQWHHKGVEAIAYNEENKHSALWETLEAWAIRANAPEKWYQSIIDHSRNGPENLQPYERGQVAHIISTVEGARKFSEAEPPPPSQWLCVFDPAQRYAKPVNDFNSSDPIVDPFNWYGLDSDPPPISIDPKNYLAQRDIPAGVWDAFAINLQDQKNLQESHLPGLRGHWATNVPNLPSRLHLLGIWIKNVADQPGSVLWAASQIGLHPNIQQLIKSELARTEKDIHSAIRQAWSYLFEAWEAKHDSFHHEWYDLKAEIDQDGWNNTIIRKYAVISRPYLTVRRGSLSSSKSLEQIKKLQVESLLHLNVEYPSDPTGLEVPDDWFFPVIRELRKNIEHALQLEMELGGYGMINIAPIISDDQPDGDSYSRTHGLSGSIISFSSLFSRLMELDVTLAHQELEAWPEEDETVFNRLRVWAGRNSQLVSPREFGKTISGLSNDTFWNRSYRRDLLLVLAKRWKELPDDIQQKIEKQLLQGPAQWNGEADNEYEERRAWASLTRITWMANNGCEFTFDLKSETEKLRASAPKWQPEYAEKAVDSHEGRVGFVKTETEYSALLNEPLDSILSKALALSGRAEQDFLIEKDPFTGLSNNFPVRAFSALTHAARKDEYPEWAWRAFLNSEIRKNDKPKFSALIAERICLYPCEVITSLIRPITEWLLKISEQLSTSFPETFDKLIEKLLEVVSQQPPASSSVIIQSSKGIDWPMEAINAPVGKIAQTLCNDPRMNDTDGDEGFSSLWIKHVESLLSLNGDLRRHALVIFSFNLNWFYATDPGWTESNLLSVLNGDKNEDCKAAWSGFLWGARVPNQNLYMLIKERLLTYVVEKTFSDRGLREVLAWIILAGWGSINGETGKRCITNSEMRNVLLHADDQFRSQILWQIKKWSETMETDTEPKWLELQHEFLRDVWPRQKSVKTSTVSLGLCDLAFSNAKKFPEIVEIILPLLTTIDRDHLMLPHMRNSKDTIVNLYPEQTLALLHAILPDNVSSWPYGIEETLQQISTANSTLDSDERLLELKRKWNSR